MYERIFDFEQDGDPICYTVSHKAALCYAALIYYADEAGEVRDWVKVMGVTNIPYTEFKGLRDELIQAGLIESCKREDCYGQVTAIRLLNFSLPKRIDRLSGPAWAAIRSKVFERDNYTCQYCHARGVELECDHVIPISLGGTNEMGNLVTACRDCNRSKRAKALEEWKA